MTTALGGSLAYDRLIGNTRLLALDEVGRKFGLPSSVTLLAKL